MNIFHLRVDDPRLKIRTYDVNFSLFLKRSEKRPSEMNVKIAAKDGKIVTLKEERNLLQRFTIIARKRSDLDLQQCIGEYEFGVVPRALFAADGSMLLEKLKYKVSNLIRNAVIVGSTPTIPIISQPQKKIIILDGMAIVNALPKDKNPPFPIKTCEDLGKLFVRQLTSLCSGYDEARLAFDRYVVTSLKWMTREARKNRMKSTQYRIMDATIIKDVKLKQLLSHVNTKKDQTIYLAEKSLAYSKSPSTKLKKFMVTYDTLTRGNTDVPESLIHHDHEEADTLILLHAASLHPSSRVDIYASDTDILLQLVNR